jgi:hypothetical protein
MRNYLCAAVAAVASIMVIAPAQAMVTCGITTNTGNANTYSFDDSDTYTWSETVFTVNGELRDANSRREPWFGPKPWRAQWQGRYLVIAALAEATEYSFVIGPSLGSTAGFGRDARAVLWHGRRQVGWGTCRFAD